MFTTFELNYKENNIKTTTKSEIKLYFAQICSSRFEVSEKRERE